jgi:hypothetical protein
MELSEKAHAKLLDRNSAALTEYLQKQPPEYLPYTVHHLAGMCIRLSATNGGMTRKELHKWLDYVLDHIDEPARAN